MILKKYLIFFLVYILNVSNYNIYSQNGNFLVLKQYTNNCFLSSIIHSVYPVLKNCKFNSGIVLHRVFLHILNTQNAKDFDFLIGIIVFTYYNRCVISKKILHAYFVCMVSIGKF